MQHMKIEEQQTNGNHESTAEPSRADEKDDKTTARVKELTDKLTSNSADINVPNELKEFFIQVLAQQKPLMLIYLIKTLGYRHTLCFVKTKESAQRLNMLLELNGIKSCEYSSTLHAARRKRVQNKFEENKLDVLVCSDVMARGMDLKNVDYVVLYDAPNHLSSYIHRVGRTARAGRSGTAITLLEQKEIFFFKKMTKSINSSTNLKEKSVEMIKEKCEEKSQHKIREIKVPKSKLKHLVDEFRSSLGKLKESLRTSNKSKRKSEQNPEQQNGSAKRKRDTRVTSETTPTSQTSAIKSNTELSEQP
jgi:ATP-dependent RNA helicase DDX51/DBP6